MSYSHIIYCSYTFKSRFHITVKSNIVSFYLISSVIDTVLCLFMFDHHPPYFLCHRYKWTYSIWRQILYMKENVKCIFLNEPIWLYIIPPFPCLVSCMHIGNSQPPSGNNLSDIMEIFSTAVRLYRWCQHPNKPTVGFESCGSCGLVLCAGMLIKFTSRVFSKRFLLLFPRLGNFLAQAKTFS